MPKVYLAADHAGFALKSVLLERLQDAGYGVEDLGAFMLENEDDYPDVVTLCAQKVAEENAHGEMACVFGVVIGASGQGEAMAANRVPGVRAAVFYGTAAQAQTDAVGTSLDMIASVRAHNDANILSLGARFLSADEAYGATMRFLETPFSNAARHTRRLAKF